MKINRILWLSFWLTCASGPAGLPAALTPEKLYQKVLPSVMTLEVENHSGERFVGSAVLALADDVALTAWHVVADARTVWAVFADGQRVPVVGRIDYDGERDLALLKLEKRLPRRQAAVCSELQAVASRTYVIGAPKGYDFSISDGLISQIQSVNGWLQYQLSCPVSPGNSGSPVFNPRGEVVAIASWTKADAQNVNFAIPTREFLRLKASAPLMTWAQVAASERPPATASATHSLIAPEETRVADAGRGTFSAFQKRLGDSAGKSVTVVLQEAGRTNVFTFIAP